MRFFPAALENVRPSRSATAHAGRGLLKLIQVHLTAIRSSVLGAREAHVTGPQRWDALRLLCPHALASDSLRQLPEGLGQALSDWMQPEGLPDDVASSSRVRDGLAFALTPPLLELCDRLDALSPAQVVASLKAASRQRWTRPAQNRAAEYHLASRVGFDTEVVEGSSALLECVPRREDSFQPRWASLPLTEHGTAWADVLLDAHQVVIDTLKLEPNRRLSGALWPVLGDRTFSRSIDSIEVLGSQSFLQSLTLLMPRKVEGWSPLQLMDALVEQGLLLRAAKFPANFIAPLANAGLVPTAGVRVGADGRLYLSEQLETLVRNFPDQTTKRLVTGRGCPLAVTAVPVVQPSGAVTTLEGSALQRFNRSMARLVRIAHDAAPASQI